MGWLFGRKKEMPPVPPRPEEGRALRFPGSARGERIIEPDEVKAAAGFGKGRDVFAEEIPAPEPVQKLTQKQVAARLTAAPVYLKVGAYKKILGEVDSLRSDLLHLQERNTHLQSSEYNEEHHFTKLRRHVKVLHDYLLQVDRTLFKS